MNSPSNSDSQDSSDVDAQPGQTEPESAQQSEANATAPESEPAPVATDQDELPEWEELTPELMEDECLRGDFMLRWAVILLALLTSWVYVTETPVLIEARAGQYMLSHGILPPRTDVFSATAQDRSWVNLGWLSDLIVGAIANLGTTWLTVLCAVTLAISFWCLSRVSVPGFSTWWGSVCGALALVAVFPVVQPGTSSATILGLSVLMLLFARWTMNPQSKSLWGLPVLFLFWTNSDPRCWIGLALLVAFTIGVSIKGSEVDRSARKRNLLIAGITILIGIFANPWPGQPVLQPAVMLAEQAQAQAYGGVSEFFPGLTQALRDQAFWLTLDQFDIVALILWGVSLVVLLLNVRHIHGGWTAVWLAANLLAVLYGSMVCYAAVVNAAVATLSGQNWYRSRFSLEFSIDTWSVLWGRAGRAVCVLALFFVAYLAVNGALMGPQGRRIGMGLDPRWRLRIDSLERSVLPAAFQKRIFPTLPVQGDLLIWLGYEPYVDSRLALYLADENLLERHRQIRASIFSSETSGDDEPAAEGATPEAQSTGWKAGLAEYDITDLLLRLWGPIPPYDPVLRLLGNRDWQLTGWGASGALFTRSDLENAALQKHNQQHRATQFRKIAFQPEEKPTPVVLEPTWPAAQSNYNRWLIQRLEVTPAPAQLASHYEALLAGLSGLLTPQQGAGLASIAVRESRRALIEDANQPLPYRVLTTSYTVLQQIEQQAAMATGNQPDQGAYQAQIIAAAFSAAKTSNDMPGDLLRLYQALIAQQEMDTARQILGRLERSLAERPEYALPENEQQRLKEMRQQLDDAIHQVQEQIDTARKDGAPRAQLVGIALQGRCPSLALSIIEEDLTELTRAPDMQMLYASLLLRTGDLQGAWTQVEGLADLLAAGNQQQRGPNPLLTQWRALAAEINTAVQDMQRAATLREEEQTGMMSQSIRALLQQPFAASAAPVLLDLWPAVTARLTASAAIETPERWAQLQLERVRGALAGGRLQHAQELLEEILEATPRFSQRGVVVFYLQMLTDKQYDVQPPTVDVPDWPDPFAPQASEPPPVPLPQPVEKSKS